MADVHDPQIRSYNMSKIKSKNTKPEILIRNFLHTQGFRYRIHVKSLPGKPDIVLSKYRTIIQVNGCFWHGHENCQYFKIPKSRTDWWLTKILKTKALDKVNLQKLINDKWNCVIIWECAVKDKINSSKKMEKLQELGLTYKSFYV